MVETQKHQKRSNNQQEVMRESQEHCSKKHNRVSLWWKDKSLAAETYSEVMLETPERSSTSVVGSNVLKVESVSTKKHKVILDNQEPRPSSKNVVGIYTRKSRV